MGGAASYVGGKGGAWPAAGANDRAGALTGSARQRSPEKRGQRADKREASLRAPAWRSEQRRLWWLPAAGCPLFCPPGAFAGGVAWRETGDSRGRRGREEGQQEQGRGEQRALPAAGAVSQPCACLGWLGAGLAAAACLPVCWAALEVLPLAQSRSRQLVHSSAGGSHGGEVCLAAGAEPRSQQRWGQQQQQRRQSGAALPGQGSGEGSSRTGWAGKGSAESRRGCGPGHARAFGWAFQPTQTAVAGLLVGAGKPRPAGRCCWPFWTRGWAASSRRGGKGSAGRAVWVGGVGVGAPAGPARHRSSLPVLPAG